MGRVKILLISLLMILLPISLQAQENDPVVYGVFFYSPSCPHCHEVINNNWDGIQSEFGDQLKVMFINVQIPEGSQLMQTARAAMGIEQSGVPMLIIGDQVLVGSYDIPALAPTIIRDGLASGGINVPPIPNMEDIFISVMGDDYLINDYTQITEQTSMMSDSANIVAIGMLFALIVSLFAMIGAGLNKKMRYMISGDTGFIALILVTFFGVLLSASLLIGSENGWVTALVTVMLVAFVAMLFLLVKQWSYSNFSSLLIPLLLLVGVIVAGYMTYVESTASEAVCGLVDNCNLVQQSEYAQIAGVPIGVIGLLGYAALFFVWLASQVNRKAYVVMLVLISVGVIFSIYLTYLEPFVIGASCVWCLTSALTMVALLWVVAPMALETFENTMPTTTSKVAA